MKNYIFLVCLLFLLAGCKKELVFENQSFDKKTSLPCQENCPQISIKIPVAKGIPIVADSINNKIFSVVKSVVYFGEKPYTVSDYNGLTSSFINSYEKMKKDFPEDSFGWEAKINGSIKYQSEMILNIEINHYTYTGGAHGYQGLKSLLFDPNTGKSISNDLIFKQPIAFKAFAEKKFRAKYNIPENQNINATGMQFEDDTFQIAQNIFYTDKGLLLRYNPYEAASYADGPMELFFPYDEVNTYLLLK
jgi:hypothetical protein